MHEVKMEDKETKHQPLHSTLMAFNSLAFVVLLLIGTLLLIKSQYFYSSEQVILAVNAHLDDTFPREASMSFALAYWITLVVGILCIIVAAMLLWNIIDLLFFVIEIPDHLRGLISYQDSVKEEIKYCYNKY